jgi:hypothetical protein
MIQGNQEKVGLFIEHTKLFLCLVIKGKKNKKKAFFLIFFLKTIR